VDSLGDNKCALRVDYQIIYISNVNFVLRTFIEKSARGGMLQNFEELVKVLEGSVPLIDLRRKENLRKEQAQKTTKDIRSFPIDDLPSVLVERVEQKDRSSKAIKKSDRLQRNITALFLAIIFPLRILFILPSIYTWLQGAPTIPSSGLTPHTPWKRVAAALVEFVRSVSRMLLMLCTAYVIHNVLTGLRVRCESLGGVFSELAVTVFNFIDLPVSFRQVVSGGLFMLFVAKIVELGLITH